MVRDERRADDAVVEAVGNGVGDAEVGFRPLRERFEEIAHGVVARRRVDDGAEVRVERGDRRGERSGGMRGVGVVVVLAAALVVVVAAPREEVREVGDGLHEPDAVLLGLQPFVDF